MKPAHGPDYGAAPIVAYKHSLIYTLGIHHTNQVIAEYADIILHRILRAPSHTKTALIRRNGVIAGISDRAKLVAPAVGQFWKAMTENYGWT
jgi:hypothetical protein